MDCCVGVSTALSEEITGGVGWSGVIGVKVWYLLLFQFFGMYQMDKSSSWDQGGTNVRYV